MNLNCNTAHLAECKIIYLQEANRAQNGAAVHAYASMCILFITVINRKIDSQGKPTRHPVRYMLTKTDEGQ